jgi:hypothetical protein
MNSSSVGGKRDRGGCLISYLVNKLKKKNCSNSERNGSVSSREVRPVVVQDLSIWLDKGMDNFQGLDKFQLSEAEV